MPIQKHLAKQKIEVDTPHMSLTLFKTVLVLTCATASVRAQGTLTTVDGNTVKFLKVLKKEPHSVTVETDAGITRVTYEKLSQTSRAFFGMTAEKLAAYRAKQEEEEAIRELDALPDSAESESTAGSADPAPQQPMAKASTQDATPVRLATVEKVKGYWIRAFPQPRSLDSDYHKRRAAYVAFVEKIRKGDFDHLARKAMLEWNIAEFERVGNVDAANRLRGDMEGAIRDISVHRNQELERERNRVDELRADAEKEKAKAIDNQAGAIRSKAWATERLASEIRSNTRAVKQEADYTKELSDTLNRLDFRWRH